MRASRSASGARLQPTTRGSVLIVEDDDDTRDAVASLVESEGFAPIAVAHGKAALETLEKIAPPRFILLDMMMPEMSGWEFRKVQRNHPILSKIPTIVFTAGHTAPWDIEHVIVKPLSIDKFRRTLKLVLGA